MKSKNFLSNLWSLLVGSRKDDGSTRLRVVYVSFTCRLRVWPLKIVAVLAILLTIGIGNAWGAKYSMTPNKATTGSSSTVYITSLTEFTYANPTGSSLKWDMNQWNPDNLQVKTNQSSAANEFRFYTNSALPGKITKVVVKFQTLTLKNTTTTGFKFVGGSKAVTSTSGGTDGTWNSSAKTLTWTPGSSDNYTYFAMYQNGKVATGTNNLATSDAIVVTYLTKVTLDKNGGTADGVAYFDDNATAASTATGYTFSAATRTSGYTCNGYYTASSGGTKVLNADGTFAAATVSEYITSSKWTYAGGTLKLYAQWEAAAACTATPSIGAASLNGSFNLSSVGVSCASSGAGTNCSITEYGWVWSDGTNNTNPTIGGSGVTNSPKTSGAPSGSGGSFTGTLSGSFTLGHTYYYKAYVTNGKPATEYSAAQTFTPRSVTFDLNGHGSSAPSTQYVNNGGKATDPSYSEIVEGWSFGGWYKEAGCTNAWDFSTDVVSGDNVTLYAKWTEIVKNPEISPSTGTYNANQSVSITCATTSANIYYTITTDGTTPADPTESSTSYSGTITVDHTGTKIKAKAFKAGCVASSVVSATYTLTCAPPAISVAAGTYTVAKDVTISSTTPGATIRYTTDGTTPTASVGTIYSGPVHVDESMTLKAIAYKDNYNNSSVASAAYTMNIPATVTFVTGTGNPSVDSKTEASKGSGIELPAGPTPACSGDGWVFVGWAESSCSETTKAPELFMPEDEISPESNKTMYAVYRKLTSGTSTATFNAADISNLTEHSTYSRDWRDNTGGVELYIEDGQRYTGNASNPAAWNVTKSTAYTDHFALIDAHRKISSITIECTGASYMFASVDKDAGTAVLSTSSTTQTVTCSGNVTQVYLISNTSQQVRATSIAVTYYNAKFNSNPTCKDVKSIAITTAPTKITYCAGETFDPAGMEIRVTYTDDSSDDIAYDEHEGDFSFSPSTSTSLTTGNSSVTVTYREKDASQAITVNASRTISLTGSGTVTGGTFSADNSTACVGATITLTATPSEHYSLGSWTVTKSGGGTVTVTSNQFTMPDENVTVNATFTEDPYRTVVFKNSGSSLYSGDGFDATNNWKQKVYVGETPVWPTKLDDSEACDATSNKFYGWATNTWSDVLDDTDALEAWDGGSVYTAGPLATIAAGTGDVVYHAVWAEQSETPSNEYQLVTNISQLSAGDKIVIAGAKTTSTYLLGYQRHTDAGYHFRPQSYNAYTITSSKVTLTSSDIAAIASDETHPYVLTLGKNGDYWTFYDAVNGGYLCATTADKNELNVRAEDSDGASRFTISISSDAASITSQVTPESTPHNLLQYLTNTFSCYKSTSGGTNPYIFRNLSTLSNSNFMTTCCDKHITIGTPSITGSGTVTFTLGGNAIAPGDEVETCSVAKDIVATVTPAAGYSCTALSFSGGSVSVDPTPGAGNYPSAPSAQNYTLSFEANTTATLATTATFTAKTASAWEWKYNGEEIPDPLVLYVGINKQLDVTYTPDDLLNTQKNYTVTKTDVHVAQGGKAYDHYTMRGAAGVTEVTNTTVTFTLSGLSKEVNVTVKPQPRVHFVDIVHGESFADVGPAVVSYVATFIQPTPTHSDVSDPGENYNSCERGHLHLLGWIESTWADAHPGATSGEITGAGSGIYYEAGASINVEVQNGKTFYAVWCIVE